jgi:hypothetical protein
LNQRSPGSSEGGGASMASGGHDVSVNEMQHGLGAQSHSEKVSVFKLSGVVLD